MPLDNDQIIAEEIAREKNSAQSQSPSFDDDVSDSDKGIYTSPDVAGAAEFSNPAFVAGTTFARPVTPPAMLDNALGRYNSRADNYTTLKVPPLEIPHGLGVNDRILYAAKYYADNLLGRQVGDPKYRQFGIDTGHAWCAETVNAIFRCAGLKDSGSALAISESDIGKRINSDNIQAGDVVVHRDGDGHGHTGIIWNVKRDSAGHVVSYVMLNGNHSRTLAFSTVSNPSGYAEYYRHDGTPGNHAPDPAVAEQIHPTTAAPKKEPMVASTTSSAAPKPAALSLQPTG